MSFFGLTAFGPENFVKTTLVNFGCKKLIKINTNINIF